MSIAAINEQLLRAVGVGLAIFDEATLRIQFRNDVFVEWFGQDAIGLDELFPDLDADAMRAAVKADGRFTSETSFRKKRRTMVVAQIITRADVGDEAVYVLECQNITRIRELEAMIESYSTMVERHTRDLQREKEQLEKLLLNVMPRTAYDDYKNFGVVDPKRYDSVSIVTLDFMNFADILERLPPASFVSELNELYTAFDQIGEQFGCERIKTTSDTYLCVAGMHDAADDNVSAAANAALRFLRYLKRRNDNAETQWICRLGLGAGVVVGSVVGAQNYVYDVFGPAVSSATAAREAAADMEALVAPEALAVLGEAFRLESPRRADPESGLMALAAAP